MMLLDLIVITFACWDGDRDVVIVHADHIDVRGFTFQMPEGETLKMNSTIRYFRRALDTAIAMGELD